MSIILLWGIFAAELLLVEFAMKSPCCELDVSIVTSCIVPPLVFRPVPGCSIAICAFAILQVVEIPVVE